MAVTSLVLCFASCLSQGYLKADYDDFYASNILVNSNNVIEIASEESFNYNTNSVDDSDLMNCLLTFNETYDLLTSSELFKMRFLTRAAMNQGPILLNDFNNSMLDMYSLIDDFYYRPELEIAETIDTSILAGTSDSDTTLYRKNADERKALIVLNPIMNNSLLLGMYASADACMITYNTFALFAETFIDDKIAELIQIFSLAFPLAVAELSALFYSFFQPFLIFIKSSVAGVLFAVVFSFFALFTAIQIASMIYCGRKGQGFIVGWLIDSNFNWHWKNQPLSN